MDNKEKIRRELLERYISTGKVGLIKPSSDDEAIDLIETVVELYKPQEVVEKPADNTPIKITVSELSDQFQKMLDF